MYRRIANDRARSGRQVGRTQRLEHEDLSGGKETHVDTPGLVIRAGEIIASPSHACVDVNVEAETLRVGKTENDVDSPARSPVRSPELSQRSPASPNSESAPRSELES